MNIFYIIEHIPTFIDMLSKINIFYIIAFLPMFIGGILWAMNKNIEWEEWWIGSLLALIMAWCFSGMSFYSKTIDVETWSGEITKAFYHPEWVEKRKTQKGSKYTTHAEYWDAYSNINTKIKIDKKKFDEMKEKLQSDLVEISNNSSRYYSGNQNTYAIYNKTNEIHYPITEQKTWYNRIKAAPSIFSYPKIDDPKIPEWPKNDNPWISNRLIGEVGQITIKEWENIDKTQSLTRNKCFEKHINELRKLKQTD